MRTTTRNTERHRETFPNKELKDLLKSLTDDDDDDAAEDLEEAGLSIWTLEKFAAVFQRWNC